MTLVSTPAQVAIQHNHAQRRGAPEDQKRWAPAEPAEPDTHEQTVEKEQRDRVAQEVA